MMDKESAQFLQAAVGLMLVARPIDGEFRVEQQDDGEYHVVSDTEDFWEDGMVYEHEAKIVASLCNLGLFNVMETCEILTAVERERPELYKGWDNQVAAAEVSDDDHE